MPTPGLRIKNARTASGLSKKDVAQQTGINAKTIALAERDAIVLGSDNLSKICTTLKISADFVLTGKVDAPLNAPLPLKKLIFDIYFFGELSTAFSAFRDLKTDQMKLIAKVAKTMAVENKKQKK